MDETWSNWVTQVDGEEVEEVDDQNYLRDDGVVADPEHHPGELEDVIEDKVASDSCGGLHHLILGAEQVPDVNNLEGPKYDPVDADKDMRDGERCHHMIAFARDSVTMLSIVGSVQGVVNSCNEL